MMISLFDGLLVAPAMSAYLGGRAPSHAAPQSKFGHYNAILLKKFDNLQAWLEKEYVRLLKICLKKPKTTLSSALGIFVLSILIAGSVPFTFLPPQDNGEFVF